MKRIFSLKKELGFSRLAAIIAVLSLTVLYLISCTKSDKKTLAGSNSANEQKMDATNSVIEASNSDDENFDAIMESGEFADAALNAVASTLSGEVVITYSPEKNVFPHTKPLITVPAIPPMPGIRDPVRLLLLILMQATGKPRIIIIT
jgi:hypothetical protein